MLLNACADKHYNTDQDGDAARTVGGRAARRAVPRGTYFLSESARTKSESVSIYNVRKIELFDVEYPKVENCLY
jgi:hypothetical protein